MDPPVASTSTAEAVAPIQPTIPPNATLAATRTRRARPKRGDDDDGAPGRSAGRRGAGGQPRVKIKPPADVTGYQLDPNGIGFDRELDSDPEDPPATEEQFILRLPPKLAKKVAPRVENRTIGEETYFKFKDSRRGVFHVDGKDYGAKLVDLPALIESQRFTGTGGQTLKVADISQMLLVEDQVVADENDVTKGNKAFNIEDFIFPHGLTPPLRHVRKRRFRRRINKRNIELIENAVEKLLEADSKADQVQYEYLDHYVSDEEDEDEGPSAAEAQRGYRNATQGREGSMSAETPAANTDFDGASQRDENEDYDEDGGTGGEGDEDEEGEDEDEEDEGFDSDLANEINKGLEAMNKAASSSEDSDSEAGDDLFGGTSNDDGDDDENAAENDDADAATTSDPVLLEKKRRIKLLAEETADLDKAIASKEAELAKNQNPIFKKRFEEMIKKLTTERDIKRNQHLAAVRDLEKSTTTATEAALASSSAQVREEDKMDES